MSNRTAAAIYLSPLLVLATAILLTALAPTCGDLLDGDCKTNVFSDLSYLTYLVALPISLVIALAMAVTRRKRRDHHGTGR